LNGNHRISSSAERAALAEGDFLHAEQLLGHRYSISGHVIHGQKLGRDIGFPTLNLRVPHRPALGGIFVVQVHGLGPQPLPAVASLGVRPTVEDAGRVLLEVHIFDFAQHCYGKLVRVEFLKKLRDEEKFIDLPTLVTAIERDAAQARDFFATRNSN
jgi:riboflavin kinase/FMN adenylyltransferase